MAEDAAKAAMINTRANGEAAAEWVSIDRLKAWAKNPRNNALAVSRVAESIKRFGFGNPIVARRADGEIIAGHTRFAAAKQLRLATVPVRFLDLAEAEAHLLALADNRLGEIAAWDRDAQASAINNYALDDLTLAGFSAVEVDKILDTGGGVDEIVEVDVSSVEPRSGLAPSLAAADAQADLALRKWFHRAGVKPLRQWMASTRSGDDGGSTGMRYTAVVFEGSAQATTGSET